MALRSAGILLAGACYSASASAAGVDASALVQEATRARRAAAGLLAGRLAARVGAEQLPQMPGQLGQQLRPLLSLAKFDCSKEPRMCEPPFNCQTFDPLELVKVGLQGVATDGRANFHIWCIAPYYVDYLHTCLVEKDLRKAGQIQFQWSLDQRNGVDELDASYCFLEGHCTNEAVTANTTLEESYQMCDDRYGHLGWTEFGKVTSLPPLLMRALTPGALSFQDGFHDPKITRHFLKAACAMGNYHCDVVYCKETYCQKEYYVKKYAHLQPKAPGHLIKQRDWLY